MLLFIDESGQDHREAPYEILAGVAIREQDLWNLFQSVESLENELFGVHKPEHGAQLNRSKPHTLTGACRTPKPE